MIHLKVVKKLSNVMLENIDTESSKKILNGWLMVSGTNENFKEYLRSILFRISNGGENAND